MAIFTERERAYLKERRLGRLATANGDGQPHVVPVGFRYNPESETIDIAGRNLQESKKYRDIQTNPAVAFVVDDLLSTDPWHPRGILVRGQAQLFEDGGERFGSGFGSAWIQITPKRIISWGLDTGLFEANRRTVR